MAANDGKTPREYSAYRSKIKKTMSERRANELWASLNNSSPLCKTLFTPLKPSTPSSRLFNSTSCKRHKGQGQGQDRLISRVATSLNWGTDTGTATVDVDEEDSSALMTRRSKTPGPASKHEWRVRAMEREALEASRKQQVSKDLANHLEHKAFAAWLNFTLTRPMKPAPKDDDVLSDSRAPEVPPPSTPKLSRVKSLKVPKGGASTKSSDKFTPRLSSLQDLGALPKLKERLRIYMDHSSADDVVLTITKVSSQIDDGRLKMREERAILGDVGLREKIVQVFMNYNPVWLKIGLYIVLGHIDLAVKERPVILCGENLVSENRREDPVEFLKLVIEKSFLSHNALSKSYASNKGIDGLYRPGYYEALGRVILKRILLFVLALDRAKIQNTLPISDGIDGLDGGSQLLFCRNTKISSSRLALQGFLSNVMLGEGDLLSHLATIGYHLAHVQPALSGYDFHVSNPIESLEDGVRLCRLIQILMQDTTILKRVTAPCDHQKKFLNNCNLGFQYLLKAGVPLKDKDGATIVAESVVFGDRDKIMELLWNIFSFLQIPLLISNEKLREEIASIRSRRDPNLELHQAVSSNSTTIEMIYKWIEEICATYGKNVHDLNSTFCDLKIFLYVIDFYVPGHVPPKLLKEDVNNDPSELTVTYEAKTTLEETRAVLDTIKSIFLIPEIIDTLEADILYNEKHVIVILAFLSSLFVANKSTVYNLPPVLKEVGDDVGNGDSIRSFEISAAVLLQNHVRRWLCRSMYLKMKAAAIKLQSIWKGSRAFLMYRKTKFSIMKIQCAWNHYKRMKKAAVKIQSSWKRSKEQIKYCIKRFSVVKIQSYWRGWLVRNSFKRNHIAAIKIQCAWRRRREQIMYCTKRFSVVKIQSYWRGWLVRNSFKRHQIAAIKIQCAWRRRREQIMYCTKKNSAVKIQSYWRGWLVWNSFIRYHTAAIRLQCAWRRARNYSHYCKSKSAAVVIQSNWRSRLVRNRFKTYHAAAIKIQCAWRRANNHSNYCESKNAAIVIQSYWRKANNHSKYYISKNAAVVIQSYWRRANIRSQYNQLVSAATVIQSSCRSRKARNNFKMHQAAAIRIQSSWKRARDHSNYSTKRIAIAKIQNYWRSWLARKHLKVQRSAVIMLQSWYRMNRCQTSFRLLKESIVIIQSFIRREFTFQSIKSGSIKMHDASQEIIPSVLILQRWWRKLLAQRVLSAILIQSHIRGWICKKAFREAKRRIICIQAYWRSYSVRQSCLDDRQKLTTLRARMTTSASNVDDNLRLGNRLTTALEALLQRTKVSEILHVCATLDVSTQHSKWCCERLVDTGAIGTILQIIDSANRSTPYGEVLKHALSVISNILKYPDLALSVIETPDLVTTVAKQLLRNKDEGFCKSAEILKRLCSVQRAVDEIEKLPLVIRKLRSLSESLDKKVEMERRNLFKLHNKTAEATRRMVERRLKEALSQQQSVNELLQHFDGVPIRRFSEIHKVKGCLDQMRNTPKTHLPRLPKPDKARDPFQDCSNRC